MSGFRTLDETEYPPSQPQGAPFDPAKVTSLVPKAATEGDPNVLHDLLYRQDDPKAPPRVTSWGAKGTADQPTMAMPTEEVEQDPGAPFGPADPTKEQLAAANPDEDKIITEQARDAAGQPPQKPMVPGSFARGGSPGKQPGGPTGDGDSIDAPVDLADHPVTQALTAQGVNPQLAAMLADSKRRQDQLAEAQEKGRTERRAANELFAMRSGFGIRGANEMLQSDLATADQREAGVKAQQAAGDQALVHAEAQRGFTRALDMDDPRSEISRQVQAITGQKDVPASLYPQIADKLKAKATAQEKKAELGQKQSEEAGRMERQRMEDETKLKVAGIQAASRGKGRGEKLEARPAQALANLSTAIDELGNMSSKEGGLGPLSTLWSKVPNTDDAVWQAHREALRDSLAGAMAGGYRPSVPLIRLIDESLPNIGDNEETKERKKTNLLRIAKKAYNHQIDTFGKTGRDVSEFTPYAEEGGQGGAARGGGGGAPAVGTRQKDKNGVLRERGADGIWRPVTG